MAGSAPPSDREMRSRVMPVPQPSSSIPRITPARSATTGAPAMSKAVRRLPPSSRVSSPIARSSMRTIGSSTTATAAPIVGPRVAVTAAAVGSPTRAGPCARTRRLIHDP
jgi:hypothetical protein